MTVKDALKAIPSPSGYNETYQLEDILTDEFIRTATDCADADELFAEVAFDGQQEFDRLNVAVLDKLIAKHSEKFSTFTAFIQTAVDLYHREA